MPSPPVDRIVQCYGDLLFDFCESILWSPITAQIAFRSVVKTIRRRARTERFHDFERAWVLRVACDRLGALAEHHGRKLTSAEQIELDSSDGVSSRLKKFDSFFHRLPIQDQILLLLRDKYGLPYPEIATAMSTPEGSLKTQRQQALRALEEWLWEAR